MGLNMLLSKVPGLESIEKNEKVIFLSRDEDGRVDGIGAVMTKTRKFDFSLGILLREYPRSRNFEPHLDDRPGICDNPL